VARLGSLRNALSFLFTRSRTENAVAEYVVREHDRGRSLEEILDDPYVVNRVSREQADRLLDRPEVVRAIGEDAVGRARDERAAR